MKKLLGMMLILSCLLLTGCWDQMEITNLALVVATGVDKGEKPEEKVVFTIQVANSRALIPGGSDGEEGFWTATGRGRTIREASYKLVHRVPRRLFFGHNRVMVLGEEAARGGVISYLDRYMRSRESRPNLYVVVARGQAKRALETKMTTFQSSGLALINLFDLGNNHAIVPVRLVQFLYDLTQGDCGAVAPIVEVVPESSVSVEERESGLPPQVLKVSNLAVFDINGRMVGELDEGETLGLLWIRGWFRRSEINVPCPVQGPQDPVTLELVGSTTTTRVQIGADGNPRFEIKLRVMLDVAEHFGNHPGLDRIGFIDSLEKRANTVIADEVRAAVAKAQLLNVDVFEFAEVLKRQHPQRWRVLRDNWQDIFPMTEVIVDCETHIGNRGMLAENPGSQQREVE